MAPTNRRPHGSTRRPSHADRHRTMSRTLSADLDCVADLIDAADLAGEVFLAAALRLALDMAGRRVPT